MVHLTVGSPVEGRDFYGRNELIKLIWDSLEKNNLLLAAPRRFGKTSIMLNLRDNPRRNWRVFLLDTEWIKDPSEFIAELAAELSKESKAREFFEKIWGKLRDSIDEVALAQFKIKLRNDISVEWREKGRELLEIVEAIDQKFLFVVDEFPLMVKKMMDKDKELAVNFLEWFRVLRQGPNSLKNSRFIIGGSIGIERLINKLGAAYTINDLEQIKVSVFSRDVATNFIIELFKSEDHTVDHLMADKILELIGPPVPYYIQILVSEMVKEARLEDVRISPEQAVRVYKNRVLGVECKTYFDDYYQRLSRYYTPQEEKVVKALLKALAKVDSIDSRNLFNIYMDASNQKGSHDDFALLMNDLVRDFYAEFDPDNQIYSFASKVLKDWWLIHYRLFDEGV